MIYTKTISAPSGGSVSDPVLTYMPITRGLIYRFELYFPPGPSGLVGVRLEDGGAPLFPSEPSEWFYGDNVTVGFDDRYFVQSPNQQLYIWYYNEDEYFDHTFQVRIAQVLNDTFIASFVPGYGQKTIEQALGELAEAQEAESTARRESIIEYFTKLKEGKA